MDARTIPDASADADLEATVEEWTRSPIDLVAAAGRHIALLVACVAMAGSLFFSEVLRWPPCVLCWYQRILMYPLALILAIGILRRDRGLHLYVLPFSLLGACVSLYHYVLTKTDWLPPPACTSGIPCTVDYLNWFGFINIPFLALTAFLIISVMLATWAAVVVPYDEDDAAVGVAPSRASMAERAGVAVIVVGVVLSFVLGSTLVQV
ncbi:MAG: Disulfide bond formation protein BdbC, competence-related [uncultured Chloroflexia bacterium]|uniref:Disulfide bond formation protein BdbC, competence-related n=1 Tax=uncultured Chloroflexia bacterium TaxID=1672391 RepID=A0A6J4JSP6_9CHLR|nr:MAG: Disulfide bond formation protein BdbC, competence-related [uncultured Chloroflexia bacterium]